MFNIQITVSAILFGGLMLAAFVFGYLLRSTRMSSLNKKIHELQQEVLTNHADVLELQKDKTLLEQKLKEYSSSPVIPITASTEEKNAEKLQDVTLRKKLLTKKSGE